MKACWRHERIRCMIFGQQNNRGRQESCHQLDFYMAKKSGKVLSTKVSLHTNAFVWYAKNMKTSFFLLFLLTSIALYHSSALGKDRRTGAGIFKRFMEPRNRFQGTNSASLCSLAGRYDNPIPPRFLAPIDSLKIPARFFFFRKKICISHHIGLKKVMHCHTGTDQFSRVNVISVKFKVCTKYYFF